MSKFRALPVPSVASIAFYGLAGLIFLVFTFISGFPPHIAIIGIVSLISAYGLLMRRSWAAWIVIGLFFIASTFSIFTLYFVAGVDILTTIAMVAYAVLTWIFTAVVIKMRKYEE
jgi:hypothetical protein